MAGVPVAAAIIIGLIASFVQSFGLTLQRKSHVQDELQPLLQRRRPIRRPLWLLGFGIYITSNIFSTLFQLDTLPIVILAPLGAVSLIFNALLARIILGDTFGPASVVGTTGVALGAVLIAVFGVVPEQEHSLDDLLTLWARPAFLAFFSIIAAMTGFVLVAAHVTAWHVHRQLRPRRIALPRRGTPTSDSLPPSNYASPRDPPPIPFLPSTRRWSSPASPLSAKFMSPDDSKPISHLTHPTKAALSHGLSIEIPPPDLKQSTPNEAQLRTLTLTGLAFAAASGTLSGMSLVLAKAAVELLVITVDHLRTGNGSNEFVRLQSWLLVAGLLIGGLLQLVYLNYSLTFASPALICPLAFCFFNLSSIFDGLVFYDQFGRLRPYQIALVSMGVVLLLLGVWVVSAIQTSGQGGVDVGAWIEEEEGTESTEHSPLLRGDNLTEVAELTPNPTVNRHITPLITQSVFASDPLSPTSPTSPTTRARFRHRTARYGNFVPDLVHPSAPTGFSIGLGASSPGFVMRPGTMSQMGSHHDRRGSQARRFLRSRSEGPAGIEAIMRGELVDEQRRGDLEESREGQGEDALRPFPRSGRGEDQEVTWWTRLFRTRDKRILLDDDAERD